MSRDNIGRRLADVLEVLRAVPNSHERELAVTKLEECAYWSALAIEGITSPIERLFPEAKKIAGKGVKS